MPLLSALSRTRMYNKTGLSGLIKLQDCMVEYTFCFWVHNSAGGRQHCRQVLLYHRPTTTVPTRWYPILVKE